MIIKLTEGCTADSLTIDGTEEIDLTDDERMTCAIHIAKFLAKQDGLNPFLADIERQYGNAKYGKICEQCGDMIVTYELDID